MKIKFLGAAKTVTGSSYLLDTGREKVLIDCGLYQGEPELEARNSLRFDFDPKEIDFVLLTHAHLDHSGLLPKLVKNGFTGRIYATYPTIDLVDIMLQDSAKVQLENLKKEYNSKYFKKNLSQWEISKLIKSKDLLYTLEDAYSTMGKFVGVVNDREIEIRDGLKLVFRESGHILGASSIEVLVDGERIVFSGDIGHEGQYLMRKPVLFEKADYALIESTYGTRIHPTKTETEDQFYSIIEKTIKRGGNVIIPSFAVERTQELLYSMHLRSVNKGFNYPVFLDSPMALKATEVFARHSKYFNSEAVEFYNGKDLFQFDNLFLVSDIKDSFSLRRRKGNVIIAGSGMCTGGRVLYHLANNITDPNSTILFVGFQAKGTLGREILDGAEFVEINYKKYKVNAELYNLTGFSAHGDKNDLSNWIASFDKNLLKTIFLVHGEEDSMAEFAEDIRRIHNLNSYIPSWKEEVLLD